LELRFILLDKVRELEVGKRIVAEKALSLAEEYLADHFPTFPVLPGVLMIEALVQSAAMLVRVTNDFQQSMIVLQEARNIKYKSFLKPGNIMRLEMKAKGIEPTSSTFIGVGYVDDEPIVEGRFKLRHFNLAEKNAAWKEVDERIILEMRKRAQLVGAC
jgi:3-hydroxyacyl-[acyl-carrier-protein] dehydratase